MRRTQSAHAHALAWALKATALLALGLYAAFVGGWLLIRQLTGDAWWPVAALNSFPMLPFTPLPIALITALILRNRAGWVLAAIPLALWLGLFGWRFLPRVSRAEAGSEPVRVMAFNLLTTNREVDAIAEAIEDAQPDLIALAELNPITDSALAKRLGEKYPYRAYYRLTGAGFGNGIYSRWPLDDLGPIRTGLGLRSVMADIYTPRGVVRFVALHPWATHVGGGWRYVEPGITQSFSDREAQITAVCDFLDQLGDRPVILAGDFNMSEFSDTYTCVNARLHDGYRAAGPGYGNTWPNARSELWPWRLFGRLPLLTRIDYVFYSNHWRAAEARVLADATGSDHRPVVVTLYETGELSN